MITNKIEATGLNDLAGHVGVTTSTMCITVDPLIRAGYVRREPDPRDGRRVALRITARSHARASGIARAGGEFVRQAQTRAEDRKDGGMKWLWIVPGSLAGIVALVALIGAMLPVAHVATRRVRFRQPPEAIWNAMSPGISQRQFRQDDVNYEVTESVPNRRLVTRISDKNLPYGGSWAYDIQPEANGSSLRITEHGEVYNPVFRFVSRFIMGHTATIDASLKALGIKLGEAVAIED